MKHYDYQKQLQEVWAKAVSLYSKGQRDSGSYFTDKETAFIESIGASAQEVYDFAEDFITAGEPDFATFAMIHDIRRAYFKDEQASQQAYPRETVDSYPSPAEASNGISYLPRIAKKAWTKLTGQLNPDIMYSCGNDRRFLKEHDIHPAEFLRKTWETKANLKALSDWIVSREEKKKSCPNC